MYAKPTQISELVVLVVDDDGLIRELVKAIVIKAGVAAVFTAATGQEALAIIGKRIIHGVFCDIEMPGMTGIDVLATIRRGDIPLDRAFLFPVPTHLPVIMLTGHSTETMVELAVRTGATGYVTKPVKPVAIQKGLDRILEKWRDVPITELRFDRIRLADYTRFVVMGNMLPRNQSVIRSLIKAIDDDDNREIALDLTNVPFIDEFGYGTLLILNGVASSKKKRLSIISESDDIKQHLQYVQIGQLIGIFPSQIDYARFITSNNKIAE